MAYTSEIEKLEARYRENPKGRNFAPLADAYRKAGLIDNAIELCQAGLQLHPDYVSGHIVHGRCLVDKKDDDGAEAVFRRVLDLDPENILALKVLAEIAERTERFDAAAEWLNRLLMADPMNGEAAEGLSRVRGKAAAQTEAAEPPPPAEEPVATLVIDAKDDEPPPAAAMEAAAPELADPEPAAPLTLDHEELEAPEIAGAPPGTGRPPRISLEYMEGPFDVGLADAETAAPAPAGFDLERTSEPGPDANVTTPSLQTFDGFDFGAAPPEASLADEIQLEEPEDLAPDPSIQVEGLARTQYEGSGLFSVDEPNRPEAEAEAAVSDLDGRPTAPAADLPLILPDDLDPSARPSRETEPMDVVAGPPPAMPPLLLPDDDGAADAAALSEVEPVVTETMAELYLRQGHREDARRVYEALSELRPDDARLRQRVADLSSPPHAAPSVPPRRASGGQSAGAFLKGILSARPGAPAPILEPAAPPPAPAARPPTPPTPPAAAEADGMAEAPRGAPTPGTPTRPASDSISLDSVFGDTGQSMPMIPALRDEATEPSAKLPAASGGFSFDDFFGTAATGGAGRSSAPPRAPRPSGRHRSPEQDEDLDQFQAWLKSLKA